MSKTKQPRLKRANPQPTMELKVFVDLVATVFSISSLTALTFSVLRLITPVQYYYEGILKLTGTDIVIHYIITGLMIVTSIIGGINSVMLLCRRTENNMDRKITGWLLLHSLFETSRVVYVFITQIVLKGNGYMQVWELVTSAVQYLLDSFLYCQIILRQ